MGGSNKVKPTEDERAMAEIAGKKWNRFTESGMIAQNEFIARQTGFRYDPENGLSIDPNGPLNADGSVKIDTADAVMANEKAYTEAMMKGATPDNIEKIAQLSQDGAKSGTEASTEMALGQQTRVLDGINNVVAMGQGQAVELDNMQSQLAQQSAGKAMADAEADQQKRATTGYLAGTLAGAGTFGVLKSKGYLDSSEPDLAAESRKGPVTDRIPGDHHPS